MTVISGDKDCATQVLLAAFDTSGEAERNCPTDTSIDQIAECVVYGSIAYRLLEDGGEGQEASFDWSTPLLSAHAVFDSIVYRNGMDCHGQQPRTFQSCYRLQMTRALGLPEAYDSICGGKESSEWSRCILDAFISKALEDASRRV